MINPCYTKGVQLFKLFRRFDLEKQERCSSDPIHTKLINDMRKNEGEMTDKMLYQILGKQLKKEDVERDPSHTAEPIVSVCVESIFSIPLRCSFILFSDRHVTIHHVIPPQKVQ